LPLRQRSDELRAQIWSSLDVSCPESAATSSSFGHISRSSVAPALLADGDYPRPVGLSSASSYHPARDSFLSSGKGT
jgi:hypothetical protein